MNRVLAIAALAWAALALAEPKASKPQVSANSAYTATFQVEDDGTCRLAVTAKDAAAPAWTLDRCVGSPEDLFFVSNSGDRVWVLHVLPEKPAKPKGGGWPKAPWYSVVVAELFDRDGKLLDARKLSSLAGTRQREKCQQLERHFKWLEGVLGVAGRAPRVTDKNEVEFETVGTTVMHLKFN